MAGYTTLGRVEGGRVRALAWRERVADVPHDRPAATPPTPVAPVPGRPLREVLPERWQDLREQWAMTTFFLFDPESWR